MPIQASLNQHKRDREFLRRVWYLSLFECVVAPRHAPITCLQLADSPTAPTTTLNEQVIIQKEGMPCLAKILCIKLNRCRVSWYRFGYSFTD